MFTKGAPTRYCRFQGTTDGEQTKIEPWPVTVPGQLRQGRLLQDCCADNNNNNPLSCYC